ncbi:sigma-54 interaction domain-containing protein [Paenibacillus tengchongensis]|uniref:sigma-54 interaction domain-containing protein n=1 Tax=Paenibacillus tengchongensis TaxID=2608684 RepID=UPI001FEB4458|nr:sigma 54-interacting transcriptional regulator [Paenibacillus tengchongensis]
MMDGLGFTERPVVFCDGEGRLIGYSLLGALLEYSARLLKRSNAYFSTLSETVNDAVTVVDHTGSVICWNSVAEQMYGISKKDILGRRIGEHFNPEDLVVMSLLDEGRIIRNTYHRPRPDTHVLINASPIFGDNGSIIGGIASESDITHWVRLNDELTTVQADRQESSSRDTNPFARLSGKGKEINEAILFAKKAAGAAAASLVISGEPGTGKEYWAQIIHQAGLRREQPFIVMNCGTVPAGMLETELFGYQGGAYSGNDLEVPGKLEAAHGGTLFLDDIDLLPLELQSKLYDYLRHQSIVRPGGSTRIPVNTRIVAATTKNLQELVAGGLFRADLYYTLSVVLITLPPLRERKEDFHAMIHLFLKEFALEYQKPIPSLAPEVMLAFVKYNWPGNIRELRTVLERCTILCDDDLITLAQLPKHLQDLQSQLESKESAEPAPAKTKAPKTPLTESEELRLIEEALVTTLGNKSAAAKLLGMSRGTLYNKIKGGKPL